MYIIKLNTLQGEIYIFVGQIVSVQLITRPSTLWGNTFIEASGGASYAVKETFKEVMSRLNDAVKVRYV